MKLADVLVVDLQRVKVITVDYLKAGSVIIDFGQNFDKGQFQSSISSCVIRCTVLLRIYGSSPLIHFSTLRKNESAFLILLSIFACIPAYSRPFPRITAHVHPLSHVPRAPISTAKWRKPMKLLNFYWHESSNTDVSCRQSGRRCGLWQREDYRWSYHPRTWRYRTDTLRSAHEVYLRVHPPPEVCRCYYQCLVMCLIQVRIQVLIESYITILSLAYHPPCLQILTVFATVVAVHAVLQSDG